MNSSNESNGTRSCLEPFKVNIDHFNNVPIFLFCLGWVVAGVLNAGVGIVQVFVPSWTDGDWIASSGLPGRAVRRTARRSR